MFLETTKAVAATLCRLLFLNKPKYFLAYLNFIVLIMSKRDVSPILQAIRNFLLGRKHITALRFQQDISPRTMPPPELPEGPHHKLSANYYYARDARREVEPPLVIAGPEAVPSLAAPAKDTPKQITATTPGPSYAWD